jgi:hypothetical protein
MVAEVRRRLDQIARREYDRAISHWECHYFGSARVYCLVGHGLAEAMTELLQSKWNLRAAQLTGGELQRAGAQGEAE